jgi:hypothetical protein
MQVGVRFAIGLYLARGVRPGIPNAVFAIILPADGVSPFGHGARSKLRQTSPIQPSMPDPGLFDETRHNQTETLPGARVLS